MIYKARFPSKRSHGQGWFRSNQAWAFAFVLGALIAVPAVSAPTSDSAGTDPIGSLIARQGLESPQAAVPVIIGLKLTESPGRARFALEVSDPLEVRAFTLANPDRVVIDMPEVLWRATDDARPSGKGAIKSYRYGLFRKGDFRFVIDVNGPVKVDMPQVLPPSGGQAFRLLIDLSPTTPDAFDAHAGWPKDLAPTTPVASADAHPLPPPAPAARGGKPIIVVDAGHGGIDPGTHGSTGLKEKDVVLAVAKELKKALEATGHYKVQLTRDTDVFIPLGERVNIARAAHGDLFVSLHADSNDHHEVRGASIYTLSEDASDKEAAKLAEKENMSDVIAGVNLTGENSPVASILIDLAQRDTLNRSARFAETVVAKLPQATMVRPTTPHRSAGFAVLKGPDIPAVLIELGYLTNTEDESEMATSAWRTRVAQAIRDAIDTHFAAETTPVTRAAANP
jgi:N-acetylmuramoyl-L-alanine amidase